MDAEDKRTESILEFCKEPRSRKEIQEFLELKDRRYFANSILKPLVKGNLLNLTMPDKPTSPNQKYYSNR
jgi:ATP-dependent DNA helicase RecG